MRILFLSVFRDYNSIESVNGTIYICVYYLLNLNYLSQMVSSSEQQIMQNLPALHRDNQGMGREEAKLLYIREASSAEVSPLTHNSHLYRLRHKKQEQGPGSVWLAICAKGIQIYEVIKYLFINFSFVNFYILLAMYILNNILIIDINILGKFCKDINSNFSLDEYRETYI